MIEVVIKAFPVPLLDHALNWCARTIGYKPMYKPKRHEDAKWEITFEFDETQSADAAYFALMWR